MHRTVTRLVVLALGVVVAGCSESAAGPDGAAVQPDSRAPDARTSPDPLSDAELWRVVSKLAADELQGRQEGSPGGLTARRFLIEELKRCGIQPAAAAGYEQPITSGAGANLLGRIPGTDSSLAQRTILISAHYDHLGSCGGEICNGAYDNAAGVTVVLGAACALAAAPPARSVLVALWDAEEPPTFLTGAMGSQFYAEHPLFPLDTIDVAIVLDLIGADLWPGAGLHFVLGGELSPEVGKIAAGVAGPAGLIPVRLGLHLVEQLPTGGQQPWSDYDAFRDRGVPVLFLSDGYTKHYHQPTDELNTLARPKLALEARYLVELVRSLAAGSHPRTGFDPTGADHVADAAGVERVLTGALGAGGLVDQLSSASKAKLTDDLAKVKQIKAGLKPGTPASPAAVQALRAAVQRVMCYTGPQYSEPICNLF